MTVSVHEKYNILVDQYDSLIVRYKLLEMKASLYENALVKIRSCGMNYSQKEKNPTAVMAENISIANEALIKGKYEG